MSSYDFGLIPLFVCFAVALVIIIIICFCCKRKWCHRVEATNCSEIKSPILLDAVEQTVSTVTGANLRERTVAMDVQLGESIGQGSFGNVFKATLLGDPVAVKVFNNRYYDAFVKEKRIYECGSMTHENILRYFAGDMKRSNGDQPEELWLITEYCPLGSLHKFLEEESIDMELCVRMCIDIAAGLAFLHHEIVDLHRRRPAIAHRDLKPSNILLRSRGECVIGDFGYAVCHASCVDQSTNLNQSDNSVFVDKETTERILAGTVRYMSPEVLSGTINRYDFDKLKCSDIYSLGLVIWEIGARTVVNGYGYGVHVLPYCEWIERSPTLQHMCDIVCARSLRPRAPDFWQHSTVMQRLRSIIEECWRPQPDSRLSAYVAKTELKRLAQLFPAKDR